jgi:carbon storage regulator
VLIPGGRQGISVLYIQGGNAMLVLTRKSGESIVIGDGITVTVAQVSGNRVKLTFDAPQECRIQRGELAQNQPSRKSSPDLTRKPSVHACAVPR